MDFEITSHFFPSVYVSVYDNLLDVKFATFEYSIYAEGQLVTEHWDFSLTQLVILVTQDSPFTLAICSHIHLKCDGFAC